MRLSEAIMLGDSLRERNPWVFLVERDGVRCGCALGGASLAFGHVATGKSGWVIELQPLLEMECPWFTGAARTDISQRFFDVDGGMETMEQLIDYVRSIEPDCDCNRFNCDCKSSQPAPETALTGFSGAPTGSN